MEVTPLTGFAIELSCSILQGSNGVYPRVG